MRFIFVLIVLSSASGSAYFTTARNSSGAEEPRARGAAEFTDRTPHVLAPPEEPKKANESSEQDRFEENIGD